MSHLVPCPHCSRHVRQTELSCPFCSGALALGHLPAPALPRARLGRAATFAFGATLAGATSLVGCGGESEGREPGGGGSSVGGTQSSGGTPSVSGNGSGGNGSGGNGSGGNGMSAGTSNGEGGNIAPPYGIPPLGGETSTGGGVIYGAPPAGMSSGGAAGGGENVSGSGSGVPLYGAAPED